MQVCTVIVFDSRDELHHRDHADIPSQTGPHQTLFQTRSLRDNCVTGKPPVVTQPAQLLAWLRNPGLFDAQAGEHA